MIDKYQLANEIGNFFGTYFEQDGKFCINNYDTIYRYDSVDALLTDWVDALVEHQYDTPDLSGYWESEIEFIYSQVIGKYPVGVRPVKNKTKDRTWEASIDVKDPYNPHGKNLHLGNYASIVDAIVARKDFAARMELEPHRRLDFWECAAEEVRAEAKAAKTESKTVTENLISAMVAYGQENYWNDSDILDILVECGLTYADFQKAGYGTFARSYFADDKSISPECVFDITAEHLQNDKHLFTCFADQGYYFLVHGLDAQDAEIAGMEWYKKTFSEPGHFSCWKTDEKDLPRLDYAEVIESTKYQDMVFNPPEKNPLDQMIFTAESKTSVNPTDRSQEVLR